MKDEIIHSKILNKFKTIVFLIRFYNQNKPVGSNNPFRIASNWEFVDEDGITNVVSGTEYLNSINSKLLKKKVIYLFNLVINLTWSDIWNATK